MSLEIDGFEISTRLIGDFNAYNILAAYSVALELNQSSKKVAFALSLIKPAPGRLNVLRSKNGLTAIVDYAHSPDALKKIISSISNFCITKNHLITVVGCGGNRDIGKRSIMGKIVAESSYLTIFTSDNPRFENPNSIIKDMMSDLSMDAKKKVYKIVDRCDAISFAVSKANKECIILIVGKGHEKTQEINGIKKPFDDLQIISNLYSHGVITVIVGGVPLTLPVNVNYFDIVGHYDTVSRYMITVNQASSLENINNNLEIRKIGLKNNNLEIEIQSNLSERFHMSITDVIGKKVIVKEIKLESGKNNFIFNRKLQEGLYIINLQNQNTRVSDKFYLDSK